MDISEYIPRHIKDALKRSMLIIASAAIGHNIMVSLGLNSNPYNWIETPWWTLQVTAFIIVFEMVVKYLESPPNRSDDLG
jgi:hypothetical protein